MDEIAKLVVDGKEYELPIVTGTEGERAIDISKLRSTTGLVTVDPGYKNTGSTRSGITFLDGENGILRYRGYPIEQLALARASYLEVAYLLTPWRAADLRSSWRSGRYGTDHPSASMLHENTKPADGWLPARRPSHGHARRAHVAALLSAFYSGFAKDIHDPESMASPGTITRLIGEDAARSRPTPTNGTASGLPYRVPTTTS